MPVLTTEQTVMALQAWANCIVREDGDRDEDAGSNLTVEQTMAAARVMLAALPHLEGRTPMNIAAVERERIKDVEIERLRAELHTSRVENVQLHTELKKTG